MFRYFFSCIEHVYVVLVRVTFSLTGDVVTSCKIPHAMKREGDNNKHLKEKKRTSFRLDGKGKKAYRLCTHVPLNMKMRILTKCVSCAKLSFPSSLPHDACLN